MKIIERETELIGEYNKIKILEPLILSIIMPRLGVMEMSNECNRLSCKDRLNELKGEESR